MVVDAVRLATASAKFPRPTIFKPSYGTAGFRAEASLLASTVFRCGLLTAARAIALGQHCGLMITASHNPEHDNGVKIVEPSGEMLTQAWEPLATELACASSDDEVSRLMARLLEQSEGGAPPGSPPQLAVLVGYDTRPSASELVSAAKAGVQAMGLHVLDLGQVSTPQLHFQVASLNNGALKWSPPPSPAAPGEELQGGATSVPEPHTSSLTAPLSLDLYFDTMLAAFEQLLPSPSPPLATGAPGSDPTTTTSSLDTLYVDCANGVGAQQLARAAGRLAKSGLKLVLINEGKPGHGGLNHKCGADYVQKERVAPAGFESVPPGSRCCSVDGDADRLVYFTLEGAQEEQGGARPVGLLDGDRVAALFALLVRDLMGGLPEEEAARIKVGVVQTAYANGASTHYLTQDLGLQVACTKTGVKHLHEVAHSFDVGVYFEANGHGTALFSPALLARLQQLEDSNPAARQLLALSRVINQTVGDALSCILAVEVALRRKVWDLGAWQALYTDLPSRQSKLGVKDRTAITTTDAERVCVTPEGLQAAVDAAVKEAGAQARAFVRPSGTEDCVRVYAEAAGTQAAADALATKVMQAVWDMAGGTGARPT